MRSPHLVLPLTYCGVEQWLARQSHKLKVGGSIPPPATKDLILKLLFLSKKDLSPRSSFLYCFHFESSNSNISSVRLQVDIGSNIF